MTSFLLKIVGIITMLSDHIGDSIVTNFFPLNLIGRFAFPIFAYQAVQGYIHTKDIKKHLIKMLIFACISQVPFMLFLSTFTNEFALNIFFTFLLGLITLLIYDKCKNKLLGFLIIICSSTIAELIKVDYGAFGILLIFSFYFFEKQFKDRNIKLFNINLSLSKILMTFTTIILCFVKYIPNIIKYPMFTDQYLIRGLFTSFSLVFILFYNGKEGLKIKYLFYIFYPLHLLILYLIRTFCI